MNMLLAYLFSICAISSNVTAATVTPYLARGDQEISIPPGCITEMSVSNGVKYTFTAPTNAIYQFGIAVEADGIMPLSKTMGVYNFSESANGDILRYPYDWEWIDESNAILGRQRLTLPGIAIEATNQVYPVTSTGSVYLVDTHELFSVTITNGSSGKVRALLKKHRIQNTGGGDKAFTKTQYDQGETASFTVLQYDNLAAAIAARNSDAASMLSGNMIQIAYRWWTADRYQFSTNQYTYCSDMFKGTFDYAIIREPEIKAWIPPIFHDNGIKVHCYQFLGAVRRASVQTNWVSEDMWLYDQNGDTFTCPTTPDGAWQLCDIRRSDVREVFVNKAVEAVTNGFDGLFLDGSDFWADAEGHRGGYVPGVTSSLAYARYLLLSEIRSAVHAANPDAKIGILANNYYDTLGEADYVIKECMYMYWIDYVSSYSNRTTKVSPARDLDYEEWQAEYIPNNKIYGSKGISPVSVHSSKSFVCDPVGMTYYDLGDFYTNDLEHWAEDLVEVARNDNIYIKEIWPMENYVQFVDKYKMKVEDTCTNVLFSLPGCGAGYDSETDRFTLLPNFVYDIKTTNEVIWSENWQTGTLNGSVESSSIDWSSSGCAAGQSNRIDAVGSFFTSGSNLRSVCMYDTSTVANASHKIYTGSIDILTNATMYSFDFRVVENSNDYPAFELLSDGSLALTLGFFGNSGTMQNYTVSNVNGSAQTGYSDVASYVLTTGNWYHVEITLSDLSGSMDNYDLKVWEVASGYNISLGNPVVDVSNLPLRSDVNILNGIQVRQVGSTTSGKTGTMYVDNIQAAINHVKLVIGEWSEDWQNSTLGGSVESSSVDWLSSGCTVGQSNRIDAVGSFFTSGSNMRSVYMYDTSTVANTSHKIYADSIDVLTNASVYSFDFMISGNDREYPVFELLSDNSLALTLGFFSNSGTMQNYTVTNVNGSTHATGYYDASSYVLTTANWYHVEMSLSDLSGSADDYDLKVWEATSGYNASLGDPVINISNLLLRADVDSINGIQIRQVGSSSSGKTGTMYIDNIRGIFE